MNDQQTPAPAEPITITVQVEEETATVTLTVRSIERREERDAFGHKDGLEAQLAVELSPGERPTTFFLSRLAQETEWIIDAKFGANGFPHFSNGFGARYLRLKTPLPEIGDVLDQAARDRGLVEQIGRDVPLIPVPITS